jgi:hypothetical protein
LAVRFDAPGDELAEGLVFGAVIDREDLGDAAVGG